jgi:protein-disulfide isomerase
MIIYSDFQCPFCGQFARDTLPALEKRYVDTGKVQLVFRHEPLENHRFAMNAAEIAECAGDQGQFWQMHDLLFQHQKELDEVGLGQRVQELHLDSARVSACKGTKVRERIEVDALSGKALGLRGTPMFVIGRTLSSGTVHVTKIESGARPLEAFVGIIDGLLAGGADTGRTR